MMENLRRSLPAFATLVWVLWASFGMAQSRLAYSLEVGTGPSLSLIESLDQAAIGFFGEPTGDSIVQILRSDVFGSSNGPRQTGGSSVAGTLRVTQAVWSSRMLSLNWDAAFSIGRAKYVLPDGAGPFIQPITVDFEYYAVTPRVFGQFDYGAGFSGRAGLGLERMWVDTAITSKVLDIRDSGVFQTAFVFSEIQYRYNETSPGLVSLGIQYGANDSFALALALGVGF